MKTNDPAADPRYQALLQLLRAADTIWNASHALFGRWDLSPSQFNVLNLLHLNPAGLSQSELSRQLVMHRSNLTGLVDRLERRGLVARHDVAGDRRTYRVALTPAGEKVIREILPFYYDGAVRVWGKLSARRAAQLLSELTAAAGNAEKIAAEIHH